MLRDVNDIKRCGKFCRTASALLCYARCYINMAIAFTERFKWHRRTKRLCTHVRDECEDFHIFMRKRKAENRLVWKLNMIPFLRSFSTSYMLWWVSLSTHCNVPLVTASHRYCYFFCCCSSSVSHHNAIVGVENFLEWETFHTKSTSHKKWEGGVQQGERARWAESKKDLLCWYFCCSVKWLSPNSLSPLLSREIESVNMA